MVGVGPAVADDSRIAATGTCFPKWKFHRIVNGSIDGSAWTRREVRVFTQVFVARRAFGSDTDYRIAFMYPGCPGPDGTETEVRISYNRNSERVKAMVWRSGLG